MLPNTTAEVVWSCNVTAIKNEREKCASLLFWERTLRVHALNYGTSLVILCIMFFWEDFIGGSSGFENVSAYVYRLLAEVYERHHRALILPTTDNILYMMPIIYVK